MFIQDLRGQQLSGETIRKYENLLARRLKPWCEGRGFRYLKQIAVDEMRQFRATWTDGSAYAAKNLERLRSFFRFCMQDDWLPKNPARGLKAPRVTSKPTLPFSSEEMTRILAACDRYDGNRERLRAFVLVMRYSGLRIGDVIALQAERLQAGKLLLYTAKTGTPVYIPLPDHVVSILGRLPTADNGRFFSTGNAKAQTARANWSRYLDALFALAGVSNAHSHRFRDTFAVELLTKGVPLENVSVLLGHSSIKVTERHYRPWVRSLQRLLEEQVTAAWGSEGSCEPPTATG